MGIIFILGVLIGLGVAVATLGIFQIGVLRIDMSDPLDNPYMFLELSKAMNDISSRRYVILRVSKKNFVTRD